jgi:hypothetical protein
MENHGRERERERRCFFFLFLGLLFRHEDGGSTGLRNFGEPILDYMARYIPDDSIKVKVSLCLTN